MILQRELRKENLLYLGQRIKPYRGSHCIPAEPQYGVPAATRVNCSHHDRAHVEHGLAGACATEEKSVAFFDAQQRSIDIALLWRQQAALAGIVFGRGSIKTYFAVE